MTSQVTTLTPNTTAQPQLGWQAKSANINNQSNCWLTYNGQYIISPYQQSVYPFPSGDAAPLLSLTSTAPAGQQNQPAPKGTCYVTLSDQVQVANPGVVSAQLSVLNNQTLLDSRTLTPNQVVTFNVNLPPNIQSVMVCAANAVDFLAVGTQSGVQYGSVNLASPFLPFVFSVSSVTDTQLTITETNTTGGSQFTSVTGLPQMGEVQIGDQPITTTSTDTPAGGPSLVTNANASQTGVAWQVNGVQSITVFNTGAGSCSVAVTGHTSGFKYITTSALASQASLTADVFPQFDVGGFDLTISGVVGVISVDVAGNLYPTQGGGGSSSTSKMQMEFHSQTNGISAGTSFVGVGVAHNTETQAQQPMAVANSPTRMVGHITDPGAGQTYTVTFRQNGVSSGTLTTTVTSGTTNFNIVGSATLAIADLVCVEVTGSAGAPNGTISVTID